MYEFLQGSWPGVCIQNIYLYQPSGKTSQGVHAPESAAATSRPSTITEAPLCSVSACPAYRQTVLTVVSEVDNAA